MSKLSFTVPDVWVLSKLPLVAEINMGQSPSSADVNELGEGMVFFQGKAEFGKLYPTPKKFCTKPAKIASVGSVLLSVRAPVGPTNIARKITAIGRGLAAISARGGITSEKYILYYFRCIEPWLSKQGTGTTFKAISGQFIKELIIPLPPVAEQNIISDKLDDLLARVESIKARLVNIPEVLKKFRQSVLNAAVNGNLTEEWRNNNCCSHNPTLNIQIEKKKWVTKNPKHNEVKRVIKRLKEFNGSQNEVGEKLPEGWSWQKLEDSVLMIVDCHNKTAPYIESGIPIVRTSNIRDGNLNWEGMKYVGREIYEYWSRRCPPEAGDIIFTREAPMGEATIIPQGQQLCLGQRTMLIRTIEKYVKAKFILTVLMSPSFRTRAESFAVGTGVKHYRVGDVSNLFIPVPPTEEQNEIVRRVDQICGYADSIQQITDSALERIDNLTHSILAKAFRGELTAQWREENSELISGLNSAEALLKRIAVEKMECSISKKRVKKSNH
ncbi:restriction endonuclease subunit S [Klebsiella michiganensis]|uniref:restriction endonuclease subunit S n=1 Tax=Klebsiella michiganensis TaxID=1134687 RepID=UPI00256ED527|nr:restriction endonuclease subunit S [Klebsiella michiganensis]MDL5434248.1 restriction endonuclease subunit S [Klebsiella michiganensis]